MSFIGYQIRWQKRNEGSEPGSSTWFNSVQLYLNSSSDDMTVSRQKDTHISPANPLVSGRCRRTLIRLEGTRWCPVCGPWPWFGWSPHPPPPNPGSPFPAVTYSCWLAKGLLQGTTFTWEALVQFPQAPTTAPCPDRSQPTPSERTTDVENPFSRLWGHFELA